MSEIEIYKDNAAEIDVKKFIDVLSVTVPFNVPRITSEMYSAWYPLMKKFSPKELRWYIQFAAENLDKFPSQKQINDKLIERRNGFLNVDPVADLMAGVKNKTNASEPIELLAKKFGGWTIIGQWPQDQWEFKRKSICEVWELVKKEYRIEGLKVEQNTSVKKSDEKTFVPRTPKELEDSLAKLSIIKNQFGIKK